MSSIKVSLACPKDQEIWDYYVFNNSYASPYHLYGWNSAIYQAYRHKNYFFLAKDHSNSIVGVLPFTCIKMPWGKQSFVSLPYCDFGGPLGNSSIQEVLVQECRKFAEKIGIPDIELRCASERKFLNNQCFRVFTDKVRMLLYLPGSSEILWKSFKSKLRSQIRRSKKEGLKQKLGGIELLDDFYRVFKINMHSLGSPVHGKQWFLELLKNFEKLARVCVVYSKMNEPIAAGIILTFNKKVYIPWASSLRKYNRYAPNMLLYWTLLAWSADNGYETFDFGRSTPNEGTYRFKKQWGAKPNKLYWYTLAKTAQKMPSFSPESISCQQGKLRHIIEKTWKILPLSLANWLGPHIRKYISL